MRRHPHRIGAFFYALWGLLHVWAGADLMRADAHEQLSMLSTAVAPDERLPRSLEPVVEAVVRFHGYNLLWFGLLALAVAVFLNWKNSITGYWVNLVVVGADDLGLLLFLILPGHLRFVDAGLGPILFVLAASFTTLGYLRRSTGLRPRGPADSRPPDANGFG